MVPFHTLRQNFLDTGHTNNEMQFIVSSVEYSSKVELSRVYLKIGIFSLHLIYIICFLHFLCVSCSCLSLQYNNKLIIIIIFYLLCNLECHFFLQTDIESAFDIKKKMANLHNNISFCLFVCYVSCNIFFNALNYQ